MPESTTLVLRRSAIAVMILNTYLKRAKGLLRIPFRTLELDGLEEYSVESLRLSNTERVGSLPFTLLSTHLAQCGCAVIIRTGLRISQSERLQMYEVVSEIYGIRPHTETQCKELSFQSAISTIADSTYTMT